jgi:hypothetical protein
MIVVATTRTPDRRPLWGLPAESADCVPLSSEPGALAWSMTVPGATSSAHNAWRAVRPQDLIRTFVIRPTRTSRLGPANGSGG